jgi:hypothetical protein
VRTEAYRQLQRVNGGMGKVLDTNKFGEMQENNSLLISYVVSYFPKQ